jgi:glycosyltransferase involved in cell wall biosynthesis
VKSVEGCCLRKGHRLSRELKAQAAINPRRYTLSRQQKSRTLKALLDPLLRGGQGQSPGESKPRPLSQWDAYLQNNPDVRVEAQRAARRRRFKTPQDFAAWHYQHFGRDEGRAIGPVNPAAPLSFDVGIHHAKERMPADLLPEYRLEWHDECVDWTVEPVVPEHGDPLAHAIGAENEATIFEIIAPANWVDKLCVNFAKLPRGKDVSLICELIDGEGAILIRGEIAPELIIDKSYVPVLDLSDLKLKTGRKYFARLYSRGGKANDRISVWARKVVAGRYVLPPKIARWRGDRVFAYGGRDRQLEGGGKLRGCLVVGDAPHLTPEALAGLVACFPEQSFAVLEARADGGWDSLWPRLAGADIAVFAGVHPSTPSAQAHYDAMCFELYRRGVCTVGLRGPSLTADEFPQLTFADGIRSRVEKAEADFARCQFQLDPAKARLFHSDRPAENLFSKLQCGTVEATCSLASLARAGRLPRVAVVSVLYKKASVIEAFIDHVMQQSFPGHIDLVLVNDHSPDGDADLARKRAEQLATEPLANRSIKVIDTAENCGNCEARLAGLAATAADLYIVIDCDCLMSPDFVSAHVFEHARDDVDAVIGPLNIESWNRDPEALVRELIAEPAKILSEASPQDVVQQDGFVNCITRNFSAKRRVVEREPLFDADFGYSAKPGSGFGWEDVEMGYRLYAHGSVIRFTERAFCVHVSHESSVAEAGKIAGSFKNFDRLFTKHPEMEFTARRWAVDTYGKLVDWASAADVDAGEPQRAAERRFEKTAAWQRPLIEAFRPEARRLKILTHRWHAPHQYELYKLPHDFTLATHIGKNEWINRWSYDQRPLRPNARLVAADQIDPGEYDLAIIHFDENILFPNLCNNVIPSSWGEAADWLRSLSGLPKIAICHGTPQFEGQYALNPAPIESFSIHESERLRLVRYFQDAGVKIVCNSWQALSEWGFADARVIWHGFDPQEFPNGSHRRHILALGEDRNRPHYRGAWEHEKVASRLDRGIQIETSAHGGAPIEPRGTNAFAVRNFRSYVDRIGEFTAYLNTTLRSPMPRSRGEAMMTGVIPVSIANHDVERFIDQGKNGFYSSEPAELADWLNHLFRHPSEARKISAAARRTATDIFNHDRYLTAWSELIGEAVGDRRHRS